MRTNMPFLCIMYMKIIYNIPYYYVDLITFYCIASHCQLVKVFNTMIFFPLQTQNALIVDAIITLTKAVRRTARQMNFYAHSIKCNDPESKWQDGTRLRRNLIQVGFRPDSNIGVGCELSVNSQCKLNELNLSSFTGY